jgi:hypothetical protein
LFIKNKKIAKKMFLSISTFYAGKDKDTADRGRRAKERIPFTLGWSSLNKIKLFFLEYLCWRKEI